MALRKLKFHPLDLFAMDHTCQNLAFSGVWLLKKARQRIKVSYLDPGHVLPPDVVKRNYYIEVCITSLANTHVSAISGGAGGGGLGTYKNAKLLLSNIYHSLSF